jgi:hypothetical protein
MALNDLVKPAVSVIAVAAVATAGFAAGYLVARDPQLLRRVARSLAGGLEKMSAAIAMSREEIADLWAEVRDDAQQDVEVGGAGEKTAAAASATAATARKKATAKRRQKTRSASTRSRAVSARTSKGTKASRRQ